MTRLEQSRWVEKNQEATEDNEWLGMFFDKYGDDYFQEFSRHFENVLTGFPASVYELTPTQYKVFCNWFVSSPDREKKWLDWLSDWAADCGPEHEKD
mgnify:FL=1